MKEEIPIRYEKSKWPHHKLPDHMKDSLIPDVIWLIYRGNYQLGWQTNDPELEIKSIKKEKA